MSQSTDVTQVVPLAETPQAQVDNEQTQAMPLVTLPAAVPAVVVPPVPPGFHPERARLVHLHRVLGRILSTPLLPPPDRADLHAYGNGVELLVRDDLNSTALVPFAALFGGTPTSEDRASTWAESGMQRYAELLTVIDGVEVRVWSLTDLPVAEKPVAEPCTHEVSHMRICVGCGESLEPTEAEAAAFAAEPEPQHDPAPAPQPETPAEHPEAA